MSEIEYKKTATPSTYLTPIKNYIIFTIPFFTAAEVVILQKLELISLFYAIAIMFLMLMFLLGVGFIIYPIIDQIFSGKREFLTRFKEDPMYLLAKY